MPVDKMKQAAVRMTPRLHAMTMKMAAREKISFGEFVRRAIEGSLATKGANR